MNILKYSISFVILLKCIIASESVVTGSHQALEEEEFERIKRRWEKVVETRDLFDHVVMKEPGLSSNSSIKLRIQKDIHLLHYLQEVWYG